MQSTVASPHRKVHTWDMENRAVEEVFREELVVDGGTHQNDLDVGSPPNKITQDHQQEITEIG